MSARPKIGETPENRGKRKNSRELEGVDAERDRNAGICVLAGWPRQRIAELVEEIEAEARADREARGIEPLGAEAILRQDPHTRPNQTKKSPAPAYHAATKAARERFWEAYSAFVAAFREAADKLKAGDRTARFPLGSFPPSLPFVSAYTSLPP